MQPVTLTGALSAFENGWTRRIAAFHSSALKFHPCTFHPSYCVQVPDLHSGPKRAVVNPLPCIRAKEVHSLGKADGLLHFRDKQINTLT